MRIRGTVPLLVACIVVSMAAVDGLRAAKHRDAEQTTVAFEPSGTGLVLVLTGVGTPPEFSFRIGAESAREIVMDLPGAGALTQQEYDPGSPLLRSVQAGPRTDGPGVRLSIALGQAAFAGIDQTGDALRLRFEPAVVPVAAAPSASHAAPPDAAAAAQPDVAAAHPDDEEYRLGPGDKVEIAVFGHDDMTKIAEVRVDGTINLPLIGNIQVAGHTASEIDDIVTKALEKDYLVDPQVSVDVKDYQSLSVTVLGEVRTPGRYYLKRNMRLIELLALAGGATREAGPEAVISRHQGAGTVQLSVDLDRLFSKDNSEANVPLESGDIITIAERKAFYIKGEVARPGSYFIGSKMTLLKALSVAGGLTQFANRRSVELLRSAGAGKALEKTVINLKDLEQGKAVDVEILPDDIVSVPRRIF